MKNILLLGLIALSTATLQAELKDIRTRHLVAPVMNHREFNPVIGLNLKTSKTDTLADVVIDIQGTNLADIKEISLFRAGLDKNGAVHENAIAAKESEPLGTVSEFQNGKTRYRINCQSADLEKGSNHFWLSVKTPGDASIKRYIHVTIVGVVTKSSKRRVADASCKQRIGVAITYPNFPVEIRAPKTGKVIEERVSKYSRIPGLIVTQKGTLVATFDNRYGHNGDLPADIDVAVSRSTDGGQTWSPVITCINARDLEGIGQGVGDPAILLDESNNRVWIAGLAAPKTGHPIWKSEAGSTSPEKCAQFILAYSDDEGETWSQPINITESIKRLGDDDTRDWGCIFQGPGNGICMRDGTLVFPAQVWATKGPGEKMGSKKVGAIVYSKDKGKTWHSSREMDFGGSESTVAELSDGSLMMNTREGIGGVRQVGVTSDLGETWDKHPSVNTEEGRLRNPFCQAILISLFNEGNSTYNFGKKAEHALIFSNPNAGKRSHMSLKVSTDDGSSWSKGLLYDERWGMGYSAIYPIDENYLGVFYESQHHYLQFLAIPYTEIFQEPIEIPAVQRNREGQVTITSNGPIFYTLDGSTPDKNSTPYTQPFELRDGGMLKAITLIDQGSSRISATSFDKAKAKWTIEATSQNGGETAENAIDDNPDTIWHSKWSGGADPLPHSVTINFGEPLTLKGFTYLPRQSNSRGGIVDRYRVEVSRDGNTWVKAAEGEFDDIKSDTVRQKVPFGRSYDAVRFMRFTSLHSIEDKPHSSAAEIGVLTR